MLKLTASNPPIKGKIKMKKNKYKVCYNVFAEVEETVRASSFEEALELVQSGEKGEITDITPLDRFEDTSYIVALPKTGEIWIEETDDEGEVEWSQLSPPEMCEHCRAEEEAKKEEKEDKAESKAN